MPDGSLVRLSLARAAERRRKLDRPLAARSSVDELAVLVDVELASPGYTDFRLVDCTAAECMAKLESDDAQAGAAFRLWYRGHADEIRRHVRTLSASSFSAVSLQTPPFSLILGRRILALKQGRATARQWIGTLRALKSKGVRAEEIERLEIVEQLETLPADEVLEDGVVADSLYDVELRPRLVAESEFGFRTASGWAACEHEIAPAQFRRRGLVGKRHHATHTVRYRHRSMGWLIARSCYSDMLTQEPQWWTVLDHEGQVVSGQTFGFLVLDVAMQFAEAQISERFHRWGRQHFSPRWQRFSLAGGEQYLECLVQLDQWPHAYTPRHFALKNVLIHIRSSVREAVDGRRVLFLDEVQSDWHADLEKDRRAIRAGEMEEVVGIADAPFRSEWPLLALKLMLWSAQQQGLDGLAWSTPELQAERWRNYGPPLLLYRKLLPEAAAQLASGLQLRQGNCALPTVPRGRIVIAVERGWSVMDAETRRVVAGPFGMQTTAQQAAARATTGESVEVPVLWLQAGPKLECVPLWGVGEQADWMGG